METHREQRPLAQHPLKSTSKLNLANRERMPQMQGSVHVRVRESSQPFRLLCSDFGRGKSTVLSFDVVEVGGCRGGGISVEEVLGLPRGLSFAFELDEEVTLGGL